MFWFTEPPLKGEAGGEPPPQAKGWERERPPQMEGKGTAIVTRGSELARKEQR